VRLQHILLVFVVELHVNQFLGCFNPSFLPRMLPKILKFEARVKDWLQRRY